MSEKENPNKRSVIRNPTIEEIESLTRKKANVGVVQAKPKQPEGEAGSELVKPQDDFEPDPVLFELPSRGTTIPHKYLSENNEVLVRRFTTQEEAMFHDFDKFPFSKAIEPQIDGCLKTNIKCADLSSIDKLAIYIFLIGKSYGEEFDVDIACTKCGETSKVPKINIIKDIEIKRVPTDYPYPFPIKLTSYKKDRGMEFTAYFRFPTIKEGGVIDGSLDILSQMKACLVKIVDDNGQIDDFHSEKIIANLDSDDRNKFRKFIQEFDEFGANLFIKNKKVCKNTKCKDGYNKVAPFILPIEAVLGDIILRVRENQ